MTIEIQYVQMPSSEAMDALVTEKLNRIAHKYDWVIRAQVHFKLENDPSGNGKICEIELSAPGPRLFAKTNSDDFEKSLAATIQELSKQLQKKKDLMKRH